MLTPTLFIGVGSTGADILKYLQRLIYEEYLQPEFPIVGLVPIVSGETDWGALPDTLQRSGVRIFIQSTAAAVAAMEAHTPVNRALREWFPTEVLRHPSYFDGAGNVRAVGRFLYWQNWEAIINKIGNVGEACKSQNSVATANQLISRRMGGAGNAGQHYVDANQLRVYVLGTLCGGTCSGLAADLGYDLQRIGLPAPTGTFTILARRQAEAAPKVAVYAANSYAALTEFDYAYMPPARRREPQRYPKGDLIPDYVYPYESIFLLCPGTMHGRPLQDANDQYDHEGLKQVIALSLFLDVTEGTNVAKADVRVNLNAVLPERSQALDDKRRPRAYWSFGAASIAYPKYALAVATGCQISKQVVSKWLRPADDLVAISNAVNATWQRLQTEVLPRLRQGDPPPEQDAEDTIRSETWIRRLRAAAMEKALPLYPRRPEQVKEGGQEPFQQRLLPGGSWHNSVISQFNKVVAHLAEEVLVQDYRGLRAKGWSVPAAQLYLSDLRDRLQKERNNRAGKNKPVIDLRVTHPHFGRLKRLEDDPWLGLAFQRPAALRERKDQLMGVVYQREVLRATGDLVAGFEVKALEVAISTIEQTDETTRQQTGLLVTLNQVERQLRACFDPNHPESPTAALHSQYSSLLAQLQRPPTNCRYIFRWGGPEEDIAGYQAALRVDEAERQIRRGLLGADGWGPGQVWALEREIISPAKAQRDRRLKAPEALAQEMWEALLPSLMGQMQALNARGQASVLLQGDDSTQDMVNYAYPYAEFNDEYRDHRVQPMVTRKTVFAGGPQGDNLTDITDFLPPENHPLSIGDLWRPVPLPGLTDKVIFYSEEPHFSSTYLAAMPIFRAHYQTRIAALGGDADIFWTDKRWCELGGPPIEIVDRAERIAFFVEQAELVFSKAESTLTQVRGFAYRKTEPPLPFYEAKVPNDSQPYAVNVGFEDDYHQTARRGKAEEFIALLEQDIVQAARGLELEKFQAAVAAVQAPWDDARAQKLQERAWSAKDDEEYNKKRRRLQAFTIYVVHKAWRGELSPEDAKVLEAYPWLRV